MADSATCKSEQRRRHLGRSGRRRRKKFLEIQQAEQKLLSAGASACHHNNPEDDDDPVGPDDRHDNHHENDTPKSKGSSLLSGVGLSSLPSDRHTVWPPRLIRRLRQQGGDWKPDDEAALQLQLGFIPGNAFRVVTRIKDLSFLGSPNRNGEPSSSKIESKSKPTQQQQISPLLLPSDTMETPVVIQVFPLALRQENEGSNGKFKSRKRRRTERVTTAPDGSSIESKTTLHNTPQSEDATSQTNKSKQGGNNAAAAVVEPFPTIFWLTHPLLKVWVSKLEVEGYVVDYEKRLKPEHETEPNVLLESMKRAHTAYGQERVRLLRLLEEVDNNNDTDLKPPSHSQIEPSTTTHETSNDTAGCKNPTGTSVKDTTESSTTFTETHARSLAQRWKSALDETRGVAGIRNFAAVKCLHAHCAHYLAEECLPEGGTVATSNSNNVVGQWVVKELAALYQERVVQKSER